MKSTRTLFNQLKKHPEAYEEIYPEFYYRILKKFQNRIGDLVTFPFSLPHPSNVDGNQIENIINYPIEQFFQRTIDLSLQNIVLQNKSEEIIYDTSLEDFVDSFRTNNRIVLYNLCSEKTESWTDLRHAKTFKHVSKQKNSSRFNGNKNLIELMTFNNGFGYFDNRNSSRLYLIYNFIAPIGTSFKDNNAETNIVKLQADRRRRPKGYFTEIHGYPISKRELEYEPAEVVKKLKF